MSDLISRSAVIDIIHKEIQRTTSWIEHDTQINIKFAVEELPTAYDVDKVVKELKEASFPDYEEEYHCGGEPLLFLGEVIDIVKGGGVNDRD